MARQNFVGLVVSQGRMNKTVKVRVQGKVYDRRIDKEVIRRKDFLVHDEGNISKEGDIVRIEAIPKMSKRKAFAIAEIKVNKGQQFAQYEDLAKERIKQEDEFEAKRFIENKENFKNIITQLEDLRKLDQLSHQITSGDEATEANYQNLINEVNSIKAKYNIKSWPSTDPIIDLELNEPVYTSETEKRVFHMKDILDKVMNDSKYAELKVKILSDKFQNRPIDEIQKSVQKNVLRKYFMDERNELPFAI
ncbi:Mrps17 protein [Candida orthopsilosis Co 90-125]|uniref:Mrps17 protein n=1 Tax=Candida orthopsilosis (strain 90-125) TaxID=1136231 RepID=H8X7P6_CANO9|nr:Mrps17 protein [Candida orthopsilosis Co 90-125]CCG23831.1 Mrps17 protein [Candida orthopsilosis Co 90-125]